MKEKKTILVISVHPDDETLGCGGTLLKHITEGDEVHCLFITSGNSEQRKLIKSVSDAYGFSSVINLNFQELDLADMSLNTIIPQIMTTLKEIKPNILYIPNRSDVHSDHRVVFSAVMACTKSFRCPFIEKILMCEVISETDFAPALNEMFFVPNYFVDISTTFHNKMEIVKLYESEILPYPHTRSLSTIESLNRYRGSLIDSEYAEAFMSLKTIIR